MDPRRLLDLAHAIVLLIKDGKIAYANAYAHSLYGYDNLIGSPVVGTIVPREETSGRNLATLVEDIQRNLGKYSLNINQNITATGRILWIIWVNSQYIDSNGEAMLLSVGIEASELIERTRMLDTIFLHSLNGIAMVDQNTELIDCNPSFFQMLGFNSKEELLGVDRDKMTPFRQHITKLTEELLAKLSKIDSAFMQHEFNKYDGTSLVADAIYSKVRDLKGDVIGYVINLRDNTDLYRKSTTDALTNTYNRRHFEELARHEIAIGLRYKKSLAIILCDVDYFKNVNDTYGHPCGDIVLSEVAFSIKSIIRESDIFARIGGEEFAILLPESDGETAYNVAEKIRSTIEQKQILCCKNTISITMSFGLSLLDATGNEPRCLEDLLVAADEKLYHAKKQGRNRIAY